MRKSRQEAAKTRERIIASAAAEFREHGIAATGLADFMKAAGLTHGVEADEAQLLIELIETLFKSWNVAREERLERNKALKELAEQKKAKSCATRQLVFPLPVVT
jgi:TetR/AcrR family transcriptional regulator, transcriptional repressor for nem operon